MAWALNDGRNRFSSIVERPFREAFGLRHADIQVVEFIEYSRR